MKKMKFNKIENFIMLVLVIAAIYQTGKLWLGDSISYDFFYSFSSLNISGSSQNNTPRAIVSPKKIAVGYGNKVFNITYPGIEGNELSAQTDRYISAVLENSTLIYTEDTNFEEYIDKKCVVYEFSFDFSINEYLLGVKTEEFSEISTINYIISVPAAGNASSNLVYFVDLKTDKTVVVENDADLKLDLSKFIDEFEVLNVNKLRYISTLQSKLNIFKNNEFVPQWTQREFQYYGVTKSNLFEVDSENTSDITEIIAENFFNGFSGVTIITDDEGVYTVSDETTIVKCYPYGVLEYYNYGRSEDGSKQTLSTAYYACKEFLANDKLLNMNLYLSDVQLNKSEGLVFSFGYSVDDIPIIIGQLIEDRINVQHAVEIVVNDNIVKKYKRYFYDYSLDGTTQETASVNFVEAMNQTIINAVNDNDITQVDDIVLGYYDKDIDTVISNFQWQTYIGEQIIVVDTKPESIPQER